MKNPRHLPSIAGLALPLLFLAVALHSTGQEQKAKTTAITNELAVAQGKIISYSFLDDSRGVHQYTIRLSGYPATFQIPSDFAKYFAKDRFESELKKGDFLSVSISAQSAGSLTSDKPVPIFAIRTERATYLDEYYTLGTHNDENDISHGGNGHNSNGNGRHFPALVSFVLLLIGLVFIVLLVGLAFIIWRPKPKSTPAPAGALIDESLQRLKKCLNRSELEQKSGEPSEEKSSEPQPMCPICGAPAEKGYLYGGDSTRLPETAAEDAAAGGEGSQPQAEVLRCSSCKRIILEYGTPTDEAPQPPPVYIADSSSHTT